MDNLSILPPSEIEAIEARVNGSTGTVVVGGVEQESDIRSLLRHHRALTGSVDGEALGRELWAAVPVVTPVRWEDIEPWLRDRYRSHALKCHAIGHAAGALSREGEIAALREEVAISRREALSACNGMDAQQGEIAHLAAELAEARGLILRNAETIRQLEANVYSTEKSRAAARADGAREERRLCAKIADDETDSKAGQRIAERIRARGGR